MFNLLSMKIINSYLEIRVKKSLLVYIFPEGGTKKTHEQNHGQRPRKDQEAERRACQWRNAIMAIIGMVLQDGLTGSAWGDWAPYAASSLHEVTQEQVPGTTARWRLRVHGLMSNNPA